MSVIHPRPLLRPPWPPGLLLAACIALISSHTPSSAHMLQDFSTDALTRNSTLILEGRVTSLRSEWDFARTRIYTHLKISVTSIHKGEASGKTLEVRFLGGSVADTTLAILEQPTFEEGEDVFLFLRPNYDVRDVPFVGGLEGKLAVSMDAATGRSVLSGHHRTLDRKDTVESIARIVLPVGGK